MTTKLAEIDRAVVRAVREALFLHVPQCAHDLPPPAAVEAERALMGALLSGAIKVSDLAPARACDFFCPLHQATIIAVEAIGTAEQEHTIARIVMALRAQDIGGESDAIVEELLRLLNDAPVVVDTPRLVAEIIEAAKRRRISRALRDADLAIRTGAPLSDMSTKIKEALRG